MIDDYILYKNIPTIDLHGEDRVGARIKTNDFILLNYKLKNKLIMIVHGKGLGILKDEIIKTLKNNKYVLEYKTSIYNSGATVALLK